MGESDTEETAPTTGVDPLVGSVLAGRYEIRRLIGEGGMGRVYAGTQRVLDRPVAVKCIHPHLLANEPMLIRFMEEARIASRFIHPNVVKIYDFGKVEAPVASTFFLVMELLSGPDLSTVIRDRGPLSIPRVHWILKQLLSALGEAHALGITHRDAKPDNIILENSPDGREHVKIIDFGIAKVHGVRGVTTTGQFVGTPQYMSPEQVRGERAEISPDLYSAGILLFQMLTGRLPFNAPTVAEVLDMQLHARRPDPREVTTRTDCPAALAEVCLRAIHADRAARYPTAEAFADALDHAVSHQGSARPEPSYGYPRPQPTSDVRALRAPADREEAARPQDRTRGRSPTPTVPISRPEARLGNFRDAERLERAADEEIERRQFDTAEGLLREGLELGRRWLQASEVELGDAALRTFGRKLGGVLRELGRLEESEVTLRDALQRSSARDVARARILAELVSTLAERGAVADAESLRLEALRIATQGDARELVSQLRRLAQSLAFTMSARPVPASGAGGPVTPPPRQSEWRLKGDTRGEHGETDEQPARRRR